MDVNRALRSAASTGKILLGIHETRKAVAAKEAKLVIIAENIPDGDASAITTLAKANKVAVYKFRGKNIELGPACGKPFSVAALAVIDAGESDVLALSREG